MSNDPTIHELHRRTEKLEAGKLDSRLFEQFADNIRGWLRRLDDEQTWFRRTLILQMFVVIVQAFGVVGALFLYFRG